MTKMKLAGKVALVTGSSSGIGKAIVKRFAEEGASVVVSSRKIDSCRLVEEEIAASGQTATSVQCDITKEADIVSLFNQTIDKYGKLDILIANAGISGGNEMVENYTLDHWNRVLSTNLTGTFLTLKEGFRRMKPSGGHIVAISSQAGVEGYSGKGVYCASKFGIRGLAHALAEEGRPYNIHVTALCPGTVNTPILKKSNTNVKYPMEVEAVADAVLFLSTLGGNSLIKDVVLERMNTN